MANQLGKFSPNLANLTRPLRELLAKRSIWRWDEAQATAFKEVKRELTAAMTLTFYDPSADARVSADASAYGLGAVLLQKCKDGWKLVAYALRSLSETEQRYAQIEKEALAITWACENVPHRQEIPGGNRPQTPGPTSELHTLPPRVLRFRLRLDRFDFSIQHTTGKHMHTADALSRAPLITTDDNSETHNLEELAQLAMDACVSELPASPATVSDLEQAQSDDPVLSMIIKYCQNGWPGKNKLNEVTLLYWEVRSHLTLNGNLLLYGRRIVIPASRQKEVLAKLHSGHQGIRRCRLRATKLSVWWPGLPSRLEQFVRSCPTCARENQKPKEPLLPSPLRDYPWQKIATDLFQHENNNYLIAVDYFSRYPEVISLSSTTSSNIIRTLKSIFARHGIPTTVVSDNGPQYSSQEFKEFTRDYNFTHITSSPHFPQSNGQAERGVKTVKKLLKETKDPFLALLSYRATPLPWCNLSPAELLMGRPIRSNIPQLEETFIPHWPYLDKFQQDNKHLKTQQKTHFDKRHRTRPLPVIPDDTEVWVRTTNNQHVSGRVTRSANTKVLRSGNARRTNTPTKSFAHHANSEQRFNRRKYFNI